MRVRPFFLVLLVVACLGTLTLAATMQILVSVPRPGRARPKPALPTVLMGPTNFVQRSITIQKGQRLTLIQDASDEHIILNGSWIGRTQYAAKEQGAPIVNAIISGLGSEAIVGPFNTAGTFHLYCPLHPGMNLLVKVV